VDRKSPIPLCRQVYDQLRQAIICGEIYAGSVIPATRSLAKKLRVSRNTILNAYEALCLEGFLVGTRGSGTRVGDSLIPPPSFPMAKPFDTRAILREAHFPSIAVRLRDQDGNVLYAYR